MINRITIGLTYTTEICKVCQPDVPEDEGKVYLETTLQQVSDALHSLGFEPVKIGNIHDLLRFLNKENKRVDFVFNISCGLSGRAQELYIPVLLEVYGIPYVFAGSLTIAACVDKSKIKALLNHAHIPSPAFEVIKSALTAEHVSVITEKLKFPMFVKPVYERTTVVFGQKNIVNTADELRERVNSLLDSYRQPVLVEELLNGREFTVAILGNGADISPLGMAEVNIKHNDSTQALFIRNRHPSSQTISYFPVKNEWVRRLLREMSTRAYDLLECHDAARVDLRMDDINQLYVIDIDPLPDLNIHSGDLACLAAMNGISYNELIQKILQNALNRREMQLASRPQ